LNLRGGPELRSARARIEPLPATLSPLISRPLVECVIAHKSRLARWLSRARIGGLFVELIGLDLRGLLIRVSLILDTLIACGLRLLHGLIVPRAIAAPRAFSLPPVRPASKVSSGIYSDTSAQCHLRSPAQHQVWPENSRLPERMDSPAPSVEIVFRRLDFKAPI